MTTSPDKSQGQAVGSKPLDLNSGATQPVDATPPVVLSYLSKGHCIIARFTTDACRSLDKPPEDLIARAKDKMELIKAERLIQFYATYENRLQNVWHRAREQSLAAGPNFKARTISILLAAGSPTLKGVLVKKHSTAGPPTLTITADPKEVKSWHFEWLLLNVSRHLIDQGILARVNPAQIRRAMLAAANGLPVTDAQIFLIDDLPKNRSDEHGYYLTHCKARGEVSLVIYDLSKLGDITLVESRVKRIEEKIQKLGMRPKGRYELLKKDILEALTFAHSGPESLALEMPLVVLAAFTAGGRPIIAGSVKATSSGVIGPPIPVTLGKDPYLIDISKGLEPQGEEGEAVNLRSYHQKLIVKMGQLVAEVKYGEPPVPGRDALGRRIDPPADTSLEIEVGEGIEKRPDGRYYALHDGQFVREENRIYLVKILLHQGDVNLTSGNIFFDGPVEISGDIDSGVSVQVGGDLLIKGEIRGGTIRCKGNITVGRGILMSEGGLVQARGNIHAAFIEGATVVCGGSLMVTKSIMAATVMAGVGVEITTGGGLISGGSLLCGKFLKTPKLGLAVGVKTLVEVGTDVASRLKLDRCKARLERVVKSSEEENAMLKTLLKKTDAQLTHDRKKQKEILLKKRPRWKAIQERLEGHVKSFSEQRSIDSEAKIYVSGLLSQNCTIRICGKPVPLSKDWIAVAVNGSSDTNGSYIVPYSGSGGAKEDEKSA